ncbi:hypothetical protein F5Y09DRAFT_337808 [Xylaria sp. FL1042]|nr:hypothetical protein F5Y09DRAFT_337808 [Xylaria sp. FL1042]
MAEHKREALSLGNSTDSTGVHISNLCDYIDTKNTTANHKDFRLFTDSLLDESVVDLAISVHEGNFENLAGLLQSIYDGLPQATDELPIPSRIGPPRSISANTAIYKALTPRAAALMYGTLPPDQTQPWQWNNIIGPRITNILLRVAERSRPSGFELSAYLHMMFIDFVEGQRKPKVAIEKLFGDFLTEGALRDVDWDNSVIARKPRFLILGRGEESVGYYHWYVIIVDIDARKAYCFDSRADQHGKASHIGAFAFLKKQWGARIPQIPMPERLIELPSFTCNEHDSSGTVPRDYFDHIITPAENYVGIKIKGYEDTNLGPNAYPLRIFQANIKLLEQAGYGKISPISEIRFGSPELEKLIAEHSITIVYHTPRDKEARPRQQGPN